MNAEMPVTSSFCNALHVHANASCPNLSICRRRRRVTDKIWHANTAIESIGVAPTAEETHDESQNTRRKPPIPKSCSPARKYRSLPDDEAVVEHGGQVVDIRTEAARPEPVRRIPHLDVVMHAVRQNTVRQRHRRWRGRGQHRQRRRQRLVGAVILVVDPRGHKQPIADEPELRKIRVAEVEGEADVQEVERRVAAGGLGLGRQEAGGVAGELALGPRGLLALQLALVRARLDVGGAVAACAVEDVRDQLLDVRLGGDVDEVGAARRRALVQPFFVADGRQTGEDRLRLGELVGLGEEGLGVAFVDLDLPVWT